MKTLPVVQPVLCCSPDTPVLPAAAAAELAELFKALADPTRVAIVNRLAALEEVCVCDLTGAFDLSQPTVSHHLRVLRDAGMVEAERRGTWAYYRLVPGALERLRLAFAGT
jgi:ArsR family transcriptional regulator